MTKPEFVETIPLLDLLDRVPPEAEVTPNNYVRWTVRRLRAMVAGEMEWDDESFGWLTKQADAVVLKAAFGVQFEVENPNQALCNFRFTVKAFRIGQT
jgi:hypothetical protein